MLVPWTQDSGTEGSRPWAAPGQCGHALPLCFGPWRQALVSLTEIYFLFVPCLVQTPGCQRAPAARLSAIVPTATTQPSLWDLCHKTLVALNSDNRTLSHHFPGSSSAHGPSSASLWRWQSKSHQMRLHRPQAPPGAGGSASHGGPSLWASWCWPCPSELSMGQLGCLQHGAWLPLQRETSGRARQRKSRLVTSYPVGAADRP